MHTLNIELKARCTDPDRIEALLHQQGADFIGEDHQVDTYFRVSSGRLKLREGTIENALIRYQRPEKKDLKRSEVILHEISGSTQSLKHILEDAMGIDIVVEKRRKIFFIENVKFHIDRVDPLGHFIEVEAIDRDGQWCEPDLQQQCLHYMDLFGISGSDLAEGSYADLLKNIK